MCKLLASFGAKVFFADALAKELIDTNSEIKKKIQKAFGADVFLADGSLDRKRMAKIIFHDDASKERLNGIVHPFVLEDIQKKIQTIKQTNNNKLIVVEAALIFEAGAEGMFDYILVVDADEEKRIERIIRRDRTTTAEVLLRIKAQMPAKKKIARADFILQNSGDMGLLKTNCQFLYKLLKRMTITL